MATPVASNQLMTPYMAAYEGLKTGVSGSIKESNLVISRGQSLATAAWGSSTNYNTRIMTRADMVNAGIWAALNGTSGYSDNLCVPFGVVSDYQLNNLWGYGGQQLNWGSSYVNTSYNNWGYVDVYLRSDYYHIRTWSTYPGDFNLMLVCWNNSNSFRGVFNTYIKLEGSTTTTLGTLTAQGEYFRSLSWDGSWVHIMSIPWFDDAGITPSSAYLSLVAAGSNDSFYSRDSSWWTPRDIAYNSTLTNARGVNIYTLHTPVAVGGNGNRTRIEIW